MKILITGATGLLGRQIGKVLAEKGHALTVVSRSLSKARETIPFPCEVIVGDLMKEALPKEKLSSIEAVINLIGEPVIGRWNKEKKQKIYDSRVIATKNLVSSLPITLKAFIGGSAMGYYGDCGDELVEESHSSGKDFLSKVCEDWEEESNAAPGRKVFVRTAVVLARAGGALDKMLLPFRAGIGGPLGSGKQWMSWIHIDDIVGLFVFALENTEVSGPLNGTAPVPVTNEVFSKALAAALGKSIGPSVPLFALKLMFADAAVTMISSIRCSSHKSETLGYVYRYKDLTLALKEICEPLRNNGDYFYGEQFLPEPPQKVFPFFQDAYNLEQITPPTLNFHIKKMSTTEIHKGTLIDYTIKIHGIPAKWKTKIEEWQPPYKFTDTQMQGPYREWRHTHEFKEFCGGTLLIDKVHYRLPMGYLGWIVGNNFVRKDVEQIFSFRRRFISKMDIPKKG